MKRAWLQRTGMGVMVGGGEVGNICVAVALGGMAVGTANVAVGRAMVGTTPVWVGVTPVGVGIPGVVVGMPWVAPATTVSKACWVSWATNVPAAWV